MPFKASSVPIRLPPLRSPPTSFRTVPQAETPSFRLAATTSFPLCLGRNIFPGCPSGLPTCLIGTQLQWPAPRKLAHLFRQPDSPVQRRDEICRAYFCESTPADEIAKRFHLHSCSVRAIVRDFARDPRRQPRFSRLPRLAPRRPQLATPSASEPVSFAARGATLADIRALLRQDGFDVSESYLFRRPRCAGVAMMCDKFIRHRNRENTPTTIPSCRTSPTSGGTGARGRTAISYKSRRPLSVLSPVLIWIASCRQHRRAAWLEQIPPLQALLALLAPKLIGKRRIGHISDLCTDEGAGLFAGLNVLPKTTYATDYSYRPSGPWPTGSSPP